MTPFRDIAMMLEGPRGSGRTYRLIHGAPQGTTLLAIDAKHAQFLREFARREGRDDLKTLVISDNRAQGLRGSGPFEPDHHTVQRWLFDAEAEVQSAIERGRELLRRAEKAEAELQALKDSTPPKENG